MIRTHPRYLYEQEDGKRLSKEIARIEERYPNPLTEEEIYSVLKDFKYIVHVAYTAGT